MLGDIRRTRSLDIKTEKNEIRNKAKSLENQTNPFLINKAIIWIFFITHLLAELVLETKLSYLINYKMILNILLNKWYNKYGDI